MENAENPKKSRQKQIMDFIITQEELRLVEECRQKLLPDYEANGCEIREYISHYPDNTNKDIIANKVYLLNKHYSTRVPRQDMANHIYALNIDSLLSKKDKSVVTKIAQCGKQYYSFATKYCAMHKPNDYPIFDNEVWKFLEYLNKQDFFSVQTSEYFAHVKDEKDGYEYYIKIYDEFMEKSGINKYTNNYRDVDRYIWGAITIYLRYHKVQSSLPPFIKSVLSSLTATAIWKVCEMIF